MIKDNQKLLNRILIILDALLICFSFRFSFFIKFEVYGFLRSLGIINISIPGFWPTFKQYSSALLYIIPGYLIIYSICSMYSPRRAHSKIYECWSIIKSNCIAIMYFIAVLFFLKISISYSREFTIYFFICNTLFSMFFRLSFRGMLKKIRKKGKNIKHIVLVGYSDTCKRYIDLILANPSWGYHILGIIDDSQSEDFNYKGITILGNTKNLSAFLAKHEDLDEIAITLHLNAYDNLEYIVNCCEKSGVHTKFIPDYNRIIPTRPQIEDVCGLAVVNIRKVPLGNWTNRFIKRVIDIFGASLALLIFAIPMIIIAIIVKTTSKGPLIFCQERVGLHNKKFKMYKFRSMREQSEVKEKKAWTVKDAMFSRRPRQSRAPSGESPAHEESPGSAGQDAGQLPVKATLRKVQQKRKPPARVRMKRRGKSSPALRRLSGLVNPIRSNVEETGLTVVRGPEETA